MRQPPTNYEFSHFEKKPRKRWSEKKIVKKKGPKLERKKGTKDPHRKFLQKKESRRRGNQKVKGRDSNPLRPNSKSRKKKDCRGQAKEEKTKRKAPATGRQSNGPWGSLGKTAGAEKNAEKLTWVL